jgi:hypothetical protein
MAIDEAALQRLLDKEAIREASLKYTRGIDRHDDDIMRQVYHPDARDDHGEYIGDAEGLMHYANSIHSDNWRVHHHFVSNMTIELDGDVAHCETYFFVTLARHRGGTDVGAGRYLDRFERRAGNWAVADRICMVECSKDALHSSPEAHRGWDEPKQSDSLKREHKSSSRT